MPAGAADETGSTNWPRRHVGRFKSAHVVDEVGEDEGPRVPVEDGARQVHPHHPYKVVSAKMHSHLCYPRASATTRSAPHGHAVYTTASTYTAGR